MNFRILFLKTFKLSHFRRLPCNLFHLIIVDIKKEFLKKLCIVLKQGVLSEFLSERSMFLAGTELSKYAGEIRSKMYF